MCDTPLVALTTLADAGTSAARALGGQGTIEYWVRFDAGADSGSSMAVSTAWDDSTTGGWFCQVTPDTIAFTLRYADAANAELDASLTITKDVWHHVACSYDGAQMSLYLDGTRVVTRAATGSFDSYSSHHHHLLHRNKLLAPAQTGADAVREIRVGNAAVYGGTSFRPCFTLDAVAGTVALFHADEGTGTTLHDAVAGSPDAVVNPGTTTWASIGAACQ